MSSEEETEDDGSRIFLVNPLPWVTDSYRKITKIADKYYEATKSKRARELTVERKSGTASIRPKPKKLPDNCKSFVIQDFIYLYKKNIHTGHFVLIFFRFLVFKYKILKKKEITFKFLPLDDHARLVFVYYSIEKYYSVLTCFLLNGMLQGFQHLTRNVTDFSLEICGLEQIFTFQPYIFFSFPS